MAKPYVIPVVVHGKAYRFQHPGNRAWLKLQSSMLDMQTQTIDMEKLLDFCFEHVVIPVEGPKLDLDSLPIAELGAWQIICPSFLRGQLDSGTIYPEDKKAQREGAKVLEKLSKE